jgi:hypothetical protein
MQEINARRIVCSAAKPPYPILKRIASTFLTACVTTAIVSFTVVLISMGLTEAFLRVWLRSWFFAFIVAFPVILIGSPIIKHFVDFLFEPKIGSKN